MSLKPCPYRHVGEEGHILCDKIKTGDREVSPNICRACPIAQINCTHLRATLDNQSRPPIIVRWGNGKTQVWDDFAQQSILMQRAACAEKVIPIHSPRDCAGCPLRQALVIADSMVAVERPPAAVAPDERRRTNRVRVPPAPPPQPIAPMIQPAPVAAVSAQSPVADTRSSVVAQKIIQLQEWLAKNVANKKSDESGEAIQPIETRPLARAVGEEKRVGWTD